jgi:TolB-like protein/Tfp pilus assembly protein PilF
VSFFGELRRRNVFRVGIAYLAAAWVLIEVTDTLVSIINAPTWIPEVLVYSVALGFPLALVLAWFYELTPEGIKATADVEAVEAVKFMGRKLDFAIIGLLVLAVGFLLVRSPLDDQALVLPNSVAVLPFDNLSPNADDAYFAAGIHDTILNELAKLQDMNVIARTSVLAYADGQTPISEIAEALNVETVMEGSVQYADGRILVTAQLIDPATSAHLWSANYDRELADVFAIQADIATNIANALEAEFSLSEQESIEKIPTQSPAAYALYLRAFSSNIRESYIPDLNQAIALDPNFALAYVERAARNINRLVGVVTNTATDEALEVERSIIEDAQRALAIDPTLGVAHALLAFVHQANWRGAEAERAFQRALELSPKDVNVLTVYGEFKVRRGEYAEAIRLLRRAIELDPNNSYPVGELEFAYRFSSDWDAAAAVAQEVVNLEPDQLGNVGWNLGMAYIEASRGNAAEALTRLQVVEQLGTRSVYRFAQMALAYSLVGRPDDAARLFAQFEEQATQEGIGDGWWALAYIAVGDYEQAMERIESAVDKLVTLDQTPLFLLASNSWGDPELDTPRFRALLDNLWIDE